SGGDEPLPAGTALAPPAGVTGRRPCGSETRRLLVAAPALSMIPCLCHILLKLRGFLWLSHRRRQARSLEMMIFANHENHAGYNNCASRNPDQGSDSCCSPHDFHDSQKSSFPSFALD